MLAAFTLGAEAVQVGSLFAVSEESSAHHSFKNRVVETGEGETVLTLKELAPVRLIRNEFYESVRLAESRGASREELIQLLGRARAKKGIFEGDLEQGELEIGQVSGQISEILPAADILKRMWEEFKKAKETICKLEV